MKKKVIDDISVITSEMIEKANNGNDIVLVGYYETIVSALNILVKNTDAEIVSVELHPFGYDKYEDVYCLEFDGNEIWVDRAYCEGNNDICPFDESLGYVEEDFYEDYLKKNKLIPTIVFGFDDVNEEESDKKKSDDILSICMDDDNCGFCFCFDDGEFATKFKYKGNKKLTSEMVASIINENVFADMN